jgi:hypothetical protein
VPPTLLRPGFWFRVAVTAAGLWLVLRTVDWSVFAGLPGRLHWPALLLAALCMWAAYPLHAVRLGLLLRQQGVVLPFTELHRITWISVFFGSFTPGGVGGDVSRLLEVHGRMPANKTGGAVAVVADRVVGFATLLLLAACAALTHRFSSATSPQELAALAPLFAASLGALCLGWIVLARMQVNGRFATLSAAAKLTLSPLAPLLAAFGVSLAIWSADFVAGWLLARALGWSVGLLEISVALAVAYTVASLPLSIGGHGVREGALVVVLGWFGLADGAPQLAVAFLALTLVWSLAGGFVYFSSASSAKTVSSKP